MFVISYKAKVPKKKITKVRHEQLLMENSSVWQSNHTRPTLFMTLHIREQMGFVSYSYFPLTSNQHPTH